MTKKKKIFGIGIGTALLIIFLILFVTFILNIEPIMEFIVYLINVLGTAIGNAILTITGGGNGGELPPPSDNQQPEDFPDCTYYDFALEFVRHFGLSNVQQFVKAYTDIGSTYIADNDEVVIIVPETFVIDCSHITQTYIHNWCIDVKGSYSCDNENHFFGCICPYTASFPETPEENDDDQQPDYTCSWREDVMRGGYCDGTCPTGKTCEMITYGQCECLYPEEQGAGIGTIFVTSLKWSGAMGGLSGMDAKCQQSAVNGGLSGTWMAIASDSTTGAWTRIPDTAYYNMNGLIIANNKADLFDGSIANFINIDENYNNIGVDSVWTGTDLAGNSYGSGDLNLNCHNWGWVSDGYFGSVGSTGSNGIGWIENTILKECKYSARIYCMRVA